MTLPDTLSALDLEDLMIALGRPTDRTNIARALAQTPIEGVAAPEGRGRAWRIPRAALLPVTVAILRRRDARAAAAARREPGPLGRYELPAARLLLARGDLAPLVPKALRRRVRAERRAALAAAAERVRRRQAEAERERRAERRRLEAEAARERGFALLISYCEVRREAQAARFPTFVEGMLETPAFAAFLEAWPYATDRRPPAWWRLPPGAVERVAERLRPWLAGRERGQPSIADLLPSGVDLTRPWPWRAGPGDA